MSEEREVKRPGEPDDMGGERAVKRPGEPDFQAHSSTTSATRSAHGEPDDSGGEREVEAPGASPSFEAHIKRLDRI